MEVVINNETSSDIVENMPKPNSNKRKLEELEEDEISIDQNGADVEKMADAGELATDEKENAIVRNNGNSAKKLKTTKIKNSVQLLHEIIEIRPLEYQLTAQGPSHKPTFKYTLTFAYDSNKLNFEGIGNSKKLAKTIASMKAINYLTKVPCFFRSQKLLDYYRQSILIELKSLNLDESILNQSSEPSTVSLKMEIASENSSQSQQKLVIVMNESSDMVDTQTKVDVEEASNSDEKKENADSIDDIKQQQKSYFELKNDKKTLEMIATNNPLNILNHLLANNFEFVFLVNDQAKHTDEFESKLFKSVLRIGKQFCLIKYKSEANAKFDLKESIYVKEDDEEFQFYGCGSSKKIAKYKAAQLALECLFNIKLSNPGN